MKVKITKEAVVITEYSCINEGEVCVNTCCFELPECFEGLSVTAAFNNIPVPVCNNKCNIPSLKKGTATLGVYAYTESEDGVTLMYSPKPTVFYVNAGSFTDENGVEEIPNISEMEQFCQSFSAEVLELIEGLETTDNKVNVIDENSTDEQYPTAKAVNDFVKNKNALIDTQIKELEDYLAENKQLTDAEIQRLDAELVEFRQNVEENNQVIDANIKTLEDGLAENNQLIDDSVQQLDTKLVGIKQNIEKSISSVSQDVAQNQTDVANLDEKYENLSNNVDTLNEGGLLMKEDFIGEQVNGWLDEHPEATTTVQDASLTSAKLNVELKNWIRRKTIDVKDYGAVGDGVSDDTQAIKNAVADVTDHTTLVFPNGHYLVNFTANKQILVNITGKKNVIIDFEHSVLEVATNGYTHYTLFNLIDCENFFIKDGILKGDRLTHDYTTTSGTHEFGYGISCASSLNSYEAGGGTPSYTLKCGGKISNCEIQNFTGDAIAIKNGMSPDTIKIENCELHHCRRQGITILDSDVVIVDGCHIHHIGKYDDINGASPMAGIDIEPASGTRNVNSVIVKNTTIEETSNEAIIGATKTTKDSTTGVITEIKTTIQSVKISNCNLGVVYITAEKNFDISDRENTKVVVENSIINYRICFATSRYIGIRDGLFLNCIINIPEVYENSSAFVSGTYIPTLQNCVLNVISTAKIGAVKLIGCVVNGGILAIHETATSSLRDCTNTIFNECSFVIGNVSGLYKFVGCAFNNCVSFASSKPLRFYNCYLDSKYVPGANYVNCTVDDEIGTET